MLEDYQHPELMHSSKHAMQLDIYIKPLKLAIEYQGEQHYRPIGHWKPNFSQQQTKDAEKKRACKEVMALLKYFPDISKAGHYVD